MNFSTAEARAKNIMAALLPYCERIELAGSVRRRRVNCNDLDLVAIPRLKENFDLFGESLGRTLPLKTFLDQAVARGKAKWIQQGPKSLSLQLSARPENYRLDLYLTDPASFGSVWLCRTGSVDHNIFLCRLAEAKRWKWETQIGLNGHGASEEEIYKQLGLPWIEPQYRELQFLRQFHQGIQRAAALRAPVQQ